MEWFSINNLDEFVDKARTIVYSKFGQWTDDDKDEIDDILSGLSKKDIDDMDTLLSHQEATNIAKSILIKQKNKRTKKIRYALSEEIFMKYIEDLNARLISNILSGLVKKGLIETSYDDKVNDFVFWIKE